MAKLNSAWHETHRMPRTAKLDERIAWHREHAQACGCRPIPAKLRDEMQRRSLMPK